jgi:hypothetical protein
VQKEYEKHKEDTFYHMLEGTETANCVSKEDGTKPEADINTLNLEDMEMSCHHEPDKNFQHIL